MQEHIAPQGIMSLINSKLKNICDRQQSKL